VAAWRFWNTPSDQVRLLKRIQRHRCAETGQRLLRSAEVDHTTLCHGRTCWRSGVCRIYA
jgi:hypothetical protein